MAFPVVSPIMRKILGTRNERMVKRYLRVVDQVSALEDQMRGFSDAELRAKTDEFRARLADGAKPIDMLHEVFAVAREAMDRAVGIRNIFNPAENFDPTRLPLAAMQAYERVRSEIDSTPPRDPTGDLLGCDPNAKIPAWQFVDIPIELYDAVRELYPESKPPFRARPFDVQIIGAVVLYEGKIAEMKTGEGKTIVAPLATYLAVLEGKQVHVVTVNDYLVQRDRDWTFPFFRALGLTVGAIHPYHMQPPQMKALAYACNVVYGTTSEFGFDYLRDNMKLSVREQFQKHRHFAIVDEVDSILIDEARTPLIISGPAHAHQPRYDLADRLARHLLEKQKAWNEADQKVQSCLVEASGLEGDIRNAADKSRIPAMKEQMDAARKRLPQLEAERDKHIQYYEVEMDKKKAQITHEGVAEAQKIAGIGSFYVGDNMDIPHLLEQAIRAHTVYQRDRDYVVAPDEDGTLSVVIVDQNTGRKMVGRQWSDGLHQAVEAKEAVPVKQETQTMATITIQNYFKLYKKLAGMTGTADTEATEFHEIYRLDVVSIPTNVPVNRDDFNDVVYMAVKDKWSSIVDEIKAMHDAGRPVLVGTTSVEKSEMLSEMLSRKHGIKHEVLNAKQHEREADIILGAGQLGAVMIATNMAGRGTDIKLGRFTTEQLIEHWKRRGICPRNVTPDMPEPEIVAACYRHIAPRELELKPAEVEKMSDEQIRLALLRKWMLTYVWTVDEKKINSMNEQQMLEALDNSANCLMHRLRLYRNVEELGGLHVVGTERHEARRIDNQLRGRSGRQGDQGSSRFFLSMEDDLMKQFASKAMLRVLSRLGMKEGVALESGMLTKSVERAQRKVEERNFLIRKNILEYDEPMDVQRGIFYGMRQDVLEGRNIKQLIFDKIDDAVADAVDTYLDKNYAANCIAEWVRDKMNVMVDADRIRGKDREDLHRIIAINAKEECSANIRVTIGEYMPNDLDPAEWDLTPLCDWAKVNCHAELKPGDLRHRSQADVRHMLEVAAERTIDEVDLSPLDQYLVNDYGARELAKWAENKFGAKIEPEKLADVDNPDDAVDLLMEQAREAYRRREVTYPVEFALEMTTAGMQQNPAQALAQFCAWVKMKYELDWSPSALPSTDPRQLREILLSQAQKWDESRITERAERGVAASGGDLDKLDQWLQSNAGVRLTDEEKVRAKDDPQSVAEEKIAQMLRGEITQFERWVLLQIFDQAWKDHLYQMDQVKESIGLRGVSQRDPRIEFKRESARLFNEMMQAVREKVTDLIFKGRLSAQVTPRPAAAQAAPAGAAPTQPGQARPPVAPAQPAIAAAVAAVAGTASQQRDLEIAERATAASGGGGGGFGPATATRRKPAPVRSAPVIGRNEPCPCGSGKKYKQCHGRKA